MRNCDESWGPIALTEPLDPALQPWATAKPKPQPQPQPQGTTLVRSVQIITFGWKWLGTVFNRSNCAQRLSELNIYPGPTKASVEDAFRCQTQMTTTRRPLSLSYELSDTFYLLSVVDQIPPQPDSTQGSGGPKGRTYSLFILQVCGAIGWPFDNLIDARPLTRSDETKQWLRHIGRCEVAYLPQRVTENSLSDQICQVSHGSQSVSAGT